MEEIKLQFKADCGNSAHGELIISVESDTVSGIFETGIQISSKEWDFNEGKVIFDSSDILRAIYLYNNWENLNNDVEKIKKIVSKLKSRNAVITFHDIEVKFRGATGKKLFLDYIIETADKLKSENRTKTAQSYRSTANILSKFLDDKDLSMEYVDSDLIADFEQYLFSKGIIRNSTSFYMRILRSVYNKAVHANLVKQCFPFANVYTGIDKTQKRAVSQSIIYDLEAEKRLSRNISISRDLFLFSFYGRGISFIDLSRLKTDNIKNGILSYVRSKTGQLLHVGVEPCMERIIKRYESYGQAKGYLFPIIYNENNFYKEYSSALRIHNLRLQRLSRRMKLEPPLTSYVARHTWATIAKKKGVPLEVISECMGHTSAGTTKIYLASLDQNVLDKANKMIISNR